MTEIAPDPIDATARAYAPDVSQDAEIKLGRVGHYSYQEVCQTATICKVHPKQFDTDAGGQLPRLVNVAGYDHDGNAFSRRGVPFGHTDSPEGEFHLNRECPWDN